MKKTLQLEDKLPKGFKLDKKNPLEFYWLSSWCFWSAIFLDSLYKFIVWSVVLYMAPKDFMR